MALFCSENGTENTVISIQCRKTSVLCQHNAWCCKSIMLCIIINESTPTMKWNGNLRLEKLVEIYFTYSAQMPRPNENENFRYIFISVYWLVTDLPRFLGARSNVIQVESSSCFLFPRETLSFHRTWVGYTLLTHKLCINFKKEEGIIIIYANGGEGRGQSKCTMGDMNIFSRERCVFQLPYSILVQLFDLGLTGTTERCCMPYMQCSPTLFTKI